MKIRTDFVTNSSSSSFVLAQKGELNEKQKAAIIRLVEKMFCGKTVLTPGQSEEEISRKLEEEYVEEEYVDEIRQALRNGETIRIGTVTFDETEYHLGNMYQKIWEVLEEEGDGNFTVIDGNLTY